MAALYFCRLESSRGASVHYQSLCTQVKVKVFVSEPSWSSVPSLSSVDALTTSSTVLQQDLPKDDVLKVNEVKGKETSTGLVAAQIDSSC